MITQEPEDMTIPRNVRIVPHGCLADLAKPIDLVAYDALQAVTGLVRNFPAIEPILRRGKFHLRGQMADGKGAVDIHGMGLKAPLQVEQLDLMPVIAGSAKGRGKAILGLTLIGLSFVPGVNAGVGQSFASAGGHLGPTAASAFQSFGSNLLGRAGGLLLLSGLAEMTAPQAVSPAGQLPSSSLPVPNVNGQGAPIPLAYGEARIVRPVVISSSFDVDVIR